MLKRAIPNGVRYRPRYVISKRPKNRPRYRKEFVALLDWPVRTEDEALAMVRKLKHVKTREGLPTPSIVDKGPGGKMCVVAYCRVRPAPEPPPRPYRPKRSRKKRRK